MNDTTRPQQAGSPGAETIEELREACQTLHEVVDRACSRLDRNVWDYLRGGTESETTVRRNRLAFDRWAFRPRVLEDMREIDTGGSFLGHKLRLPVLLCPIGSLESFHPDGPRAAMRAAAEFGVPLFLSSVGTFPLESIAEIPAGNGMKVFCLYKRGDDAWLDNVVARAVDQGYDAFAITVDSAWYSRRERDISNRFVKPWRQVPGMEFQKALNWAEHKPLSHCSGTGSCVATSPRICGAADAAPASATPAAKTVKPVTEWRRRRRMAVPPFRLLLNRLSMSVAITMTRRFRPVHSFCHHEYVGMGRGRRALPLPRTRPVPSQEGRL